LYIKGITARQQRRPASGNRHFVDISQKVKNKETNETASMPFSLSASTWSFISAISGDTTMQMPGCTRAGT